MALSAKLLFGDNNAQRYSKEFLVVKCTHKIARAYEHYIPNGNAVVDKVTITVVPPGKKDMELYEWYIDLAPKNGKIIFELPAQDGSNSIETQELLFEQAYCISMSEEYHINGSNRRLINISFTAEEVTLNGVTFRSRLSNN